MSIVAVAGHVSPDSAHLTFAYPFGRTHCIRREWMEQATSGSARGQSRFVTQTTVKAFNVAYHRADRGARRIGRERVG